MGAAFVGSPAQAQADFPDETARASVIEASLDRLSTEQGVLGFAGDLAAMNDLSGAATALEAFLLANENSEAVRTQYAVTLCRLDDVEAGKFEGAKLLSMKASTRSIDAVTAACGQLTDPAKLARGEEQP
jgi:hypothetical protein